MRLFVASAIGAFAVITATSAQAQLATERNITTALAAEAAQAALANCTSQGYKVSVTVVDRTGRSRVLLRGDDTRPYTIESSQRKAYTAYSFRNTSAAVADIVKNNPANAPLFTLPDLMPLAGGVPIKVGDETIGGIGVGGAPSGTFDEACANAGLDKIKDRLK